MIEGCRRTMGALCHLHHGQLKIETGSDQRNWVTIYSCRSVPIWCLTRRSTALEWKSLQLCCCDVACSILEFRYRLAWHRKVICRCSSDSSTGTIDVPEHFNSGSNANAFLSSPTTIISNCNATNGFSSFILTTTMIGSLVQVLRHDYLVSDYRTQVLE